jgi:hypothetical protein
MRARLNSHQQRLRPGDLRHFWRRRKSFERRREDRVRLGGAVGGLVEFGERKRGAQFETAGLLISCDLDGGEERLLGRAGVCGVLYEEDFAANAIEFDVEPMLSGLSRQRERFEVEDTPGGSLHHKAELGHWLGHRARSMCYITEI